jgi:hypothetical protein
MKARIDARFATAKETANVLGVPYSRMKKLVSLTTHSTFGDEPVARWHAFKTQQGKNSSKNSHLGLVSVYFKASDSKDKSSSKKRRATKKSASRKRHARDKVAKASR